MTTVDRFVLASPLGPLHLGLVGGHLAALTYDERACIRALARLVGAGAAVAVDPARDEVRARLEAYFAGDLHALDGIPVHVAGSAFALAVWRALRDIPPGTTESYGHLAARLGRARAGRAVGRAVGANPVSIVLPCHRVVGRHGELVGYGGGLARKRWLLAHEGVLEPEGSRVRRVDEGIERAGDVAAVTCEEGACPHR